MSRVFSFLSTHLLLVVTFFFALGISFSLQIDFIQGQIFLLPLFTGGCVLFSHLRRHPQTTLFLLLPFIASLGFVHGTLAGREPPPPDHIFQLIQQEQEAVLLCTLTKMPGFNGENSSLLVAVHSLRLKDRTDYIAAGGLVQLKLKAHWPKNLLPGDQLAIRARLDRPHTFHNPGSFDYPTYLARQDIRITGW
ncbi:MAG: ComEC/Rec2 family competence protein, partial [Desulfocapsaceae bacterium]|nr:ComEC/Rec2 family competence protein [Desulfocapsaceae bacterium]